MKKVFNKILIIIFALAVLLQSTCYADSATSWSKEPIKTTFNTSSQSESLKPKVEQQLTTENNNISTFIIIGAVILIVVVVAIIIFKASKKSKRK